MCTCRFVFCLFISHAVLVFVKCSVPLILLQLLGADPLPTLNMYANTGVQTTLTMNVLCVGREGDANSTIVVGSHLDSGTADLLFANFISHPP